MRSKRIVLISVSLFIFFGFVLLTDPREVSLIAILIPFVLLGVAFYNIFLFVVERFLKKTTKRRKARLFSLIGTVILINFALLSSIGQLTFQDTVLAVLITIIGGLYLHKFQIG